MNVPDATWSFVAAVAACGGEPPGGSAVGRESLRLRPALGLAFPSGEVEAVEPGAAAGGRTSITLGFGGLYGPDSPLPVHFTEDLIAEEEAEGSSLQRGLLDLLHHRLLSLLWRALVRHRLCGPGCGNEPALRLAQLCAIEGGALPLGLAGLACGAGSGPVLAGAVSARLGAPVVVEPCLERWEAVPEESRARFGSMLGGEVAAGDRMRTRASAYRVEVGPVPWPEAAAWEPGGERLAEALRLLRRLDRDGLDVEVVLITDTDGMPRPPVGGGSCRLGRAARLAGEGERFRRTVVHGL